MPPKRPGKLPAFFGRITRNLSLNRYAGRHAAKRGGSEVELALEKLENCISDPNTPERALPVAQLEQSVISFYVGMGI